MLRGTIRHVLRYKTCLFLIAASSQQYCWLQPTTLLAPASNRKLTQFVPSSLFFCTSFTHLLYLFLSVLVFARKMQTEAELDGGRQGMLLVIVLQGGAVVEVIAQRGIEVNT